MRVLKTFILRMLIDSETPHVLRGAVRAVADDEEYTFTDGQALLALLCEISQAALRQAESAGPEGTETDQSDRNPTLQEGGENWRGR